MYAVFEDGSRQFRVSEGDVVKLDHRETPVGESIELDHVLLVVNGADVKIGHPLVAGAKVVAEVLGELSEKYRIQKFRRRKNYRRLTGHRQYHIQVKIKSIIVG
ncbi:MAG: 50S ribosomal protein L21 [Gemmataceae bacterium]|nr:50S ribosomal protein L21 [Gemmataceae bacterium]